MFLKIQTKIVAAIMSVLVVLFSWHFSRDLYYEAIWMFPSQTTEMLDRHAQMYSLYNQTQDNTLDNTSTRFNKTGPE